MSWLDSFFQTGGVGVLSGDVTGNSTSNTVAKFSGGTVPGSIPSAGLFLVSGSTTTWTARAISAADIGSLVGDVTGTIAATQVVGIGTGVSTVPVHATNLTFDASLTPVIGMAQSTTGAGNALTIQGQAAKSGSAAAGGGIRLFTGAGDGAGAYGGIVARGVSFDIQDGAGANHFIFVQASGTSFYGSGSVLGTFTVNSGYWYQTADAGMSGIVLSAVGASQNIALNASGTSGFVRTITTNVYFQDASGNTAVIWNVSALSASSMELIKTTSFSWTQDAQTSDTATNNFLFQPQRAYASATGANRTPGNFVVDVGAPTNSGTTEAGLIVKRAGVFCGSLQPYPTAGSTYSAIYMGPNTTPSTTNFAFLSDGIGTTYLNAPTVSSTLILAFGGGAGSGGAITITAASGLQWSVATAALTFSQLQQTADAAPTNMIFKPQVAFATATTNKTSASFIVDVGAPQNSGTTEARFLFKRAGTTYAALSAFDGATGNTAMWFGNGVVPSTSNYAFAGDGSSASYFNAPVSTGQVVFQLGGVSQFYLWGSAGGASGPMLQLNNLSAAPNSNPSSAVYLYSQGGAFKGRGSSGTVTTIAPADLEGFGGHCPKCGTDFAHEWQNDKYGSLTVCMHCLAEEIGERPWIVRRKAA